MNLADRLAVAKLRRAIARAQYLAATANPAAPRLTPPRMSPSARAAVDRIEFWRRAL